MDRKRRIAWLPLVLALLLCGGCAQRTETGIEENKKYIYYLNSDANALYPVEHSDSAESTDDLIGEYTDAFLKVPQDIDAALPLGEKVELFGYELKDRILTFHFDSNYQQMKTVQRTLCNAALTKTMTQIDGVDFIIILSGEQGLTDEDGNPLEALTGSDFIDRVSDVNSVEKNSEEETEEN